MEIGWLVKSCYRFDSISSSNIEILELAFPQRSFQLGRLVASFGVSADPATLLDVVQIRSKLSVGLQERLEETLVFHWRLGKAFLVIVCEVRI